MSDQATSAPSRPAEGQSESELRAEFERQQTEILRLRDLLITKDIELGTAKGRLAELDDRSERLANAAARVEARVPGLGRLIGTALRVIQSQRH